MGVFLHKKSLIYLRLHPVATEHSIVVTLLELVRPDIRKTIRTSAPLTFDELMIRAVEAEYDEREVSKIIP